MLKIENVQQHNAALICRLAKGKEASSQSDVLPLPSVCLGFICSDGRFHSDATLSTGTGAIDELGPSAGA